MTDAEKAVQAYEDTKETDDKYSEEHAGQLRKILELRRSGL